MEVINSVNRQTYENFMQTAADIIQYFQGEERDNMLRDLRKEVETLSKLVERKNMSEKISAELAPSYDPEEASDDEENPPEVDYTANVKRYKDMIENIKPNVSNNAGLKEYDRTVTALLTDNGVCQEATNGDLQMTQNNVNLLDPVTKKRMTDPVRNIICSHVYDRESVQALIDANARSRCPVPGCKYKDPLQMKNMQTDIVTKVYLEKNLE